MDEPLVSQPELLKVAAIYARDVHSVYDDVASAAFPSARTRVTEETISILAAKMVIVVRALEAHLLPDIDAGSDGLPRTWLLLTESGFLRERNLIDFFLARVIEERLQAKLSVASRTFVSELLGHPDPNVAHGAQTLLAANSLHSHTSARSFQSLKPELLHQLCWRIVASFEVIKRNRDLRVVANAKALLADFDERQTAQAAAAKILHFLESAMVGLCADPDKVGIQLFIAYLAQVLRIDGDHVLHLINCGSVAPLGIMLRAADIELDQALATIFRFNALILSPREIALVEQGFTQLDPNSAMAEVLRWGEGRAYHLLSTADPGSAIR